MFARVVGKLVLVLGVILAIALAGLWLGTRGVGRDLIMSIARGGTYGEVRFGGGRVGVTLVPRWPVDERLRAGRAVPRNHGNDVFLPASRLSPSSSQPA